MAMTLETVKTPLGDFYLGAHGEYLVLACFAKQLKGKEPILNDRLSEIPNSTRAAKTTLKEAEQAVTAYFKGALDALDSVSLLLDGTAFQVRVWETLREKTNGGQTLSYAELSKRTGRPKASRATGTACKDNPLCLFVPCHRVLNSNGQLGAYAGGIKRKAFLIKHEEKHRSV